MGNYKEKRLIDRLLRSNEPPHITHTFSYLCKTFVEILYDHKVKNSDQFDWALCEYLDDLAVDVRETLSQYHTDFSSYINDVEAALQYFKYYLEQLDLLPIPGSLYILDGSPGTVFLLEVRM